MTGVWIGEVTAGIARLAAAVGGSAGLPDTAGIEAAYAKPRADRDGLRRAAYDVHVGLLSALASADPRLGKAYGLGRGMADACSLPDGLDALREELRGERVANIEESLADLATALPDHAARPAAMALGEWKAWGAAGSGGEWADVERRLRRQAKLWRAMLSGEKDPVDMLDLDDYLEAADRTLDRFRRLLWLYVLRVWPAALLALVVLAVGIVALVAANRVSGIFAFVVAAAGAIGITGATVTKALGTLAKRLESPLWGAELDRAIAVAISRAPETPAGPPRTHASGPTLAAPL
jgi:hypothetical protein